MIFSSGSMRSSTSSTKRKNLERNVAQRYVGRRSLILPPSPSMTVCIICQACSGLLLKLIGAIGSSAPLSLETQFGRSGQGRRWPSISLPAGGVLEQDSRPDSRGSKKSMARGDIDNHRWLLNICHRCLQCGTVEAAVSSLHLIFLCNHFP